MRLFRIRLKRSRKQAGITLSGDECYRVCLKMELKLMYTVCTNILSNFNATMHYIFNLTVYYSDFYFFLINGASKFQESFFIAHLAKKLKIIFTLTETIGVLVFILL